MSASMITYISTGARRHTDWSPSIRRIARYWVSASMITYISTGAYPFGLRSSPMIFTALADALEWGFRQRGVTVVDHYLDDFITIGPPGSDICYRNLTIILEVCRTLGIPLAQEKLEGPSALPSSASR